MEFLDYDDAAEDLTVVVMSQDNHVFCEIMINSSLLKMLSPWWKMRLTKKNALHFYHYVVPLRAGLRPLLGNQPFVFQNIRAKPCP